MKTLILFVFGLGLVYPSFSQITTNEVTIENVSSTTVDSDLTPKTTTISSLGTHNFRWLNIYGNSIIASSGKHNGFGFEPNTTYVARHWITANDGGGNLNFRFANKYVDGAGELQTETGYATHWEWTNTNGLFQWKTTETSNEAGTNIGPLLKTIAQINPANKEWYFPRADWKIRSASPFEGPKLQADQITDKAGTGSPSFPNGLISGSNLQIQETGYIDDDPTPGGVDDDYIRLNGFVEIRSSASNYGLVIRDKANSDYMGITQHDGSTYFSDNGFYTTYFLRGNGANAYTRGDLYVEGDDLYSNGGALRLNGEDDVRIAMDYNNNDNDNRKILFGKNDEGLATNWEELMRIEEAGDVVVSGGGTLRVNEITNAAGSGRPDFSKGLSASGISAINHSSPAVYNFAGNQTTFPVSLDINGGLFVKNGLKLATGGSYGGAIYQPIFRTSVNQNMRTNGSVTGWDLSMQSTASSTAAVKLNFRAGHSNTYSGANNAILDDQDGTATLTLYAQAGNRRVGINRENPSYQLDVNGTVRANNVSVSSDRRLKNKIAPIESASITLNRLKPSTYFWKTEAFPEKQFNDQRQYGLIAQEVEEVLPEIVQTDEEGYKSVEYTSLISILIKALQEKDAEIEKLENELNAFKTTVATRLDALEKASDAINDKNKDRQEAER